MRTEEFDKNFDHAFEECVRLYHFVPDASSSWEQIQKQYSKKRHNKMKRTSMFKLFPYIAAAFILGALIFGTPTVSNAFQPFLHAVITIKDDVTRVIYGTPTKQLHKDDSIHKILPPPENKNPIATLAPRVHTE
ncbi:hypothetical protein [Paenibacillus paeoniae]|uniref:Uncharacterized protein n=1 Tax=Paenibacillus paeoniae TaxID=2292705 RepID=A0A371P711_9BACL|nr:hypothetical protein [Paenibacillus paeoniae]REK71246.1 hypothetical protein DX130_22650 [Paenibacillus paeoniae]